MLLGHQLKLLALIIKLKEVRVSEVTSYLGDVDKPSVRVSEMTPSIESQSTDGVIEVSEVTLHIIVGATFLRLP